MTEIPKIKIKLENDSSEEKIRLKQDTVTNVEGTRDYRKLDNLPTINGTRLFDNYNEIDPTVVPMSLTSVKDIWDSVFNQ